jgi:hypothetical protein
MVNSPVWGKKMTGLLVRPLIKSHKQEQLTAIYSPDKGMKEKGKLAYHHKIIKLHPDFELVWINYSPWNDG